LHPARGDVVIEADAITEEVRALESLDLEALRAAWRLRYGDPPSVRSPELLRLTLAWRMQADIFGGLNAGVRRALRQARRTGASRERSLGNGARIVRSWRGVEHVVERVDDGYRWDGRTYPSLSAAALAITGVKRNGPAFFGLRSTEPSS
jgi:hypothetical protein